MRPHRTKGSAPGYYADLANDYSVKIRQLVPRYDEMVGCIIDLLQVAAPRRVLDIGAGIGNVAASLVERMPEVRVTALEVSDEMCAEAERLHRSLGDRLTFVNKDILEYAPDTRFDAVYSNLVLHNLELKDKRRVLRACREWLAADGILVWGDLIRHADDRLQRHFVEYRKNFALAAGCPAELVELNFAKETEEDHPLTVEGTLEEARSAGFEPADPVWAHDTFAIVVLRRPGNPF
jgi:ubiquinone/menaquinone biosynthesis C-methylase UbiE